MDYENGHIQRKERRAWPCVSELLSPWTLWSNKNWRSSTKARNTSVFIVLWSTSPSTVLLEFCTWTIWHSPRQRHTEGQWMKPVPWVGSLGGDASGGWPMLRAWRGCQHPPILAEDRSPSVQCHGMLELLWLGFKSSVFVYKIKNTPQMTYFPGPTEHWHLESLSSWNLL